MEENSFKNVLRVSNNWQCIKTNRQTNKNQNPPQNFPDKLSQCFYRFCLCLYLFHCLEDGLVFRTYTEYCIWDINLLMRQIRMRKSEKVKCCLISVWASAFPAFLSFLPSSLLFILFLLMSYSSFPSLLFSILCLSFSVSFLCLFLSSFLAVPFPHFLICFKLLSFHLWNLLLICLNQK